MSNEFTVSQYLAHVTPRAKRIGATTSDRCISPMCNLLYRCTSWSAVRAPQRSAEDRGLRPSPMSNLYPSLIRGPLSRSALKAHRRNAEDRSLRPLPLLASSLVGIALKTPVAERDGAMPTHCSLSHSLACELKRPQAASAKCQAARAAGPRSGRKGLSSWVAPVPEGKAGVGSSHTSAVQSGKSRLLPIHHSLFTIHYFYERIFQ